MELPALRHDDAQREKGFKLRTVLRVSRDPEEPVHDSLNPS